MKAVFLELPPFERFRKDYLDDDSFKDLQNELLATPTAGDVIKGTGGLRKIRFRDRRRGKGKRGGIRMIYYWWLEGCQFWLFTIYGKGELPDLTSDQRKLLSVMLEQEIKARKAK